MKKYTIDCTLRVKSAGCDSNFSVLLNYNGPGHWMSSSPLLEHIMVGKWIESDPLARWIDSDPNGLVPTGGSTFLTHHGDLVFNLTGFKGLALTPHKVGMKGQGRFLNHPILPRDTVFDWKLTDSYNPGFPR